jgi:hypothetical protein
MGERPRRRPRQRFNLLAQPQLVRGTIRHDVHFPFTGVIDRGRHLSSQWPNARSGEPRDATTAVSAFAQHGTTTDGTAAAEPSSTCVRLPRPTAALRNRAGPQRSGGCRASRHGSYEPPGVTALTSSPSRSSLTFIERLGASVFLTARYRSADAPHDAELACAARGRMSRRTGSELAADGGQAEPEGTQEPQGRPDRGSGHHRSAPGAAIGHRSNDVPTIAAVLSQWRR